MKRKRRTTDKKILILVLLLFVVLSCLTVGYAFSDKILSINGVVTVYKKGKLVIENIEQVETDLPTESGNGLVVDEEGNVSIDYRLIIPDKGENTYEDTYLITIFNDSHNNYTFTGFNIAPEINITGATQEEADATIAYEYVDIEGSNLSLTNNEIPAGERRYLGVKLTINATTTKENTTIDITGEGEVSSLEDHTGQFYGYLDETTENVDLKINDIDCFSFSVLNTYNEAKTFSIRPGNSNFKFVTRQGANLGNFTIPAPDEDDPDSNIEEYEACIMKKDSAIFPNDTETSSVILSSTGMASFSIGSLSVSVPKAEAKDEEKVHISDVTFSKITYNTTNQSLTVKATWNREPDESEKSTSVSNYYIQLYDSNNSSTTPVYTFTVPGDATIDNYEFQLNSSNYLNETNMVTNNHSYFIKVYGVDAAGNSGLSDCSSGTTNDYCVQSDAISLKYKFNVSLTSTNNRVSFSNTNNTVAYLNNEYTNGLTVSANNYTLDTTVTVNMGNNNLTSGTDYTFGRNTGSNTAGTITIKPNVINNDISITASATYNGVCLVEGTKIRLANGNLKNIEDIRYDDLILVLNHDTGKISYEYPIWIEQKGVSDSYQITTFSDGTILKTVGGHGIYSVDANKFVSIKDKKNFKIGTTVIKINDNEQIEKAKVTDIKTVNRKVNFYHIASTRYLNSITNDILTTDDTLIMSNMFDLDKNLIWTKDRNEFLSKKDLFSYDFLKQFFKYYLYKGLRMDEAKILQNKGVLDIGVYSDILNKKTLKPPTSNGKYKFPIMTSDELKNKSFYSKNKYQGKYYTEGSYYTLPNPIKKSNKKFIGWLNSGDNKYYKSGDKVKVIYGMYFEAIWK